MKKSVSGEPIRCGVSAQRTPGESLQSSGASCRSGFTLLELMIVLAVLALLMAISWPSLRKPLLRSATQQAARQLVTDLGRARLHAIESGRVMAFFYEPDGSSYLIVPADEAVGDSFETTPMPSSETFSEDSEFGAFSADGISDSAATIYELRIEGMFEDDVVFQDPAAIEQLDQELDATLGGLLADEMAETEEVETPLLSEAAEPEWSAPVLLYPTGRAENATFVLRGPEGYWVTVVLRGLTGALKIGPLEHEIRTGSGEDLPSEDALDDAPVDDLSEPTLLSEQEGFQP